MDTFPSICTKCQGLIVWDEEEYYRCFMCGKRYFPERPQPIILICHSTRTKRNPIEHRDYMRVYMRAYRLRRRREIL